MAKRMTQGQLLTRMHKGARILKTIINHPPSAAGVFYQLTSGQAVRVDMLERLLLDGLIRPCSDSLDLLGDNSQSYEIARNL